MENNLVSIILPTYNSSEFILDSLLSIQNQTYENWELIITDDFSADSTVQLIEEFMLEENRVSLNTHEKNLGAGISRNTSLKFAKGTYIAFCDSDDLWEPNKLESQLEFMVKNNYNFTYTNLFSEKFSQYNLPSFVEYRDLIKHNFIVTSSVIIHKDLLHQKKFNSSRKRQDYMFWLDVLRDGKNKAYLFNHSLTYYRIRKESLSSNKFSLLKYHYMIYKNEGFNTILSFIYLIRYLLYLVKKK